jgi:hypothetical protein
MYVSWLTFALLLFACLLWMLPSSRRACLVTSPVLVLYVMALVLTQYIFNMNIPELPKKAGKISIKAFGLQHFDTPPKELAFHVSCFTCYMFGVQQRWLYLDLIN